MKKEMTFLGICGAGITFCLGMYFLQTQEAEELQANIFAPPAPEQHQSVALEEILPGLHEAAEEETVPNIVLKGSVDKQEASAGEEVTYAITIHNRDEKRYENVQASALFPFEFLDFVEAKDLKNIDSQNEVLIFEKNALEGGEIWILTIRAKIKESVSGNMKIANAVTVSAKGVDLSELYDYSETLISPKPQPKTLVTSGGLTTHIIFVILGSALLLVGGRKFTRI